MVTHSFMAPEDFQDVTVRLIPKTFSLDIYKAIWSELDYLSALGNTLILSVSVALIQTFICCFIAYGLAKFKFRGNSLVFLAVILTLAIPHQTMQLSINMKFQSFDIFGILQFLNGGGITLFGHTFLEGIDLIHNTPQFTEIFANGGGLRLLNTYWPLIILSVGGIAFKNGLYIFMLRQFFRGVPDELEESAYIDGSGVFRTFFTIILPLSVPMMITVFLFAFSWQWTDDFYTGLFFVNSQDTVLMKDLLIKQPQSLMTTKQWSLPGYQEAVRQTTGIMIIAPLIVMYLFCQKYLVQGIERSGLTAD